MKYTVNSYTYTFTDNTFIIEKTTGRNKSVILNIYYTKIVSVKRNVKNGLNLTVSPFVKEFLCLTYLEGKKEKTVKIHSGEDLFFAFKEKVGDKFYE